MSRYKAELTDDGFAVVNAETGAKVDGMFTQRFRAERSAAAWNASTEALDRTELLAELRSYNPFGNYSGWETEQLRSTLQRYQGASK